ncbi:hypothetical protein G5S34_17585 [Herbaspirillum frisingense]|uniref:hypothetical protein n=1 Tax=Herbaspirillum frisingense TaxID=92645 RepID=UPI0015FEF183|nr:hypothetical protein [Herbaspirillum frisingense]QNB08385.1 hypothetical protein G5S34_17585 [Herbaspirillum frisingense]
MQTKFGRLENWLIALFLASGFCPVFLRILEVTEKIPKDKMGDYATWFSGGGTMLAVFMAYIVGERQAKAARLQATIAETRRREQYIESILAVLDACEEEMSKFEDIYDLTTEERFAVAVIYDAPIFSSLESALASINLVELNSPGAIRDMIVARHALSGFKARVDEYFSKKISDARKMYGGRPDVYDRLYLEDVKSAFSKMNVRIRGSLKHLSNGSS